MKPGFFLFFLFLLVMKVPAQDLLKEMRSDEIITINEKEYWLHTVKRGQTLYMISKAYGVQVQDIITENPDVKEGLQSGMKLKIPKTSEPSSKKKKNGIEQPPAVPQQNEMPPPEPEKPVIPCGQDKDAMKESYNIALMMPLYLGDVVSIDANSLKDDNELRSLNFLPFYEGFTMALDSLRKTGVNLKVYVYDVDKDTLKTRKVLRNPEMKNMDLIVGLLYNRNFQIVADFAKKNSIPIVNPVSERDQVTANNPFVIKVRPSLKSQPVHLAQYIERNYRGANVIFLRNKMEKIGTLPDSILSEINAKSVTEFPDVLTKLRKGDDNILIVWSDNKSYILDVITKANEVRNEFPLVLFGLPRWDMIEGVENDYLVNLKAHILAPYFINYLDNDVKKFVVNYQDKYKTDPDPLAFQGFDVAMFFSQALNMYGKSFLDCMTGIRMKALQTEFEMKQISPQSGYENLHWMLYMYDEYRLVTVKN